MSEFEDAIGQNVIVLVVLTKEKYAQQRPEILKAAKSAIPRICYITTNKPYHGLVSELSSCGLSLDGFFFIDTITKTVQQPAPVANCVFVDSPTALTDISLAFSDAMGARQCGGCFFDIISTLAIYQEPNSVLKFVHNLITKTRVLDKKAIFVALEEDGQAFISDLSMFADKIVRP